MAPSRKASNGRSPLVNQQRQITSFFTKTSSSPSPSPSPIISKQNPKSDSNPNPNLNPTTPKPSLSPTTPSPNQTKPKKPLLVIGHSTPTTLVFSKKSFGEEVKNKRIKVYWPLDQSWYEGSVKSFDKLTGKHLVQYDDADEEELDLTKEKIEWVDQKSSSFRRLRRASLVVDDDKEEEKVEDESGGDDSTDEDWGKSAVNEVVEDCSEDMELEDEEDEEKEAESTKCGKSSVSHKRKMNGEEKSESGKKSKSVRNAIQMGIKVSGKLMDPTNTSDSE